MNIIQAKKRLKLVLAVFACFSMTIAATAQECNCGPRWTASLDGVFMTRSSPASQSLVGDKPPKQGGGAAIYDAHDFNFENQIAPRFTLRRHGNCGTDLEVIYLNVNSIGASASVDTSSGGGPAGSLLVGDGGMQSSISPTKDPDLSYVSQLNSLELNCRHRTNEWVTLIAGFRWIEMDETYGWIDQGRKSDFGEFHTENDLYGFQVGGETDIWRHGRFELEGYTKVGIYANESNTTYDAQVSQSLYGTPQLASAAKGNRTSFVGEAALTGAFNITENFSLRMGYQVTFLNGIAAATDQLTALNIDDHFTEYEEEISKASGVVNNAGSAIYHGPFIRLTFQH